MAAIIDDSLIADDPGNVEIVNPAGRRSLTHVIHDIDGTHSLIRNWPPVMSLSIHWAMTSGLSDDFDSEENLKALIGRVGKEKLPETDQFCIESAGLSALTQMEYGIRRAVELGNLPEDFSIELEEEDRRRNSEITRRIWNGEERFDDVEEKPELLEFINERTPRLFKLYEAILNGACRDKNTADAWKNPKKWRVPGSMEFMQYLFDLGLTNFFVTGAVIYEEGGMFEEVQAVGFDVGERKMVEAIVGSSWDRKMPKDEVMRQLCETQGIDLERMLVIGDGRTEIKAGVEMGSVTMSRLPSDAKRQRELHIGFGVNYVVPDYTDKRLRTLISKEV